MKTHSYCKCWLTSKTLEECWGPFDTVPAAWAHLLGHPPETPAGLKEVQTYSGLGWTINEVQHYPVKS